MKNFFLDGWLIKEQKKCTGWMYLCRWPEMLSAIFSKVSLKSDTLVNSEKCPVMGEIIWVAASISSVHTSTGPSSRTECPNSTNSPSAENIPTASVFCVIPICWSNHANKVKRVTKRLTMVLSINRPRSSIITKNNISIRFFFHLCHL